MTRSPQTGTICRFALDGMPMEYFAYVPTQGQREGRLFVSIHGISLVTCCR